MLISNHITTKKEQSSAHVLPYGDVRMRNTEHSLENQASLEQISEKRIYDEFIVKGTLPRRPEVYLEFFCETTSEGDRKAMSASFKASINCG